MPVLKYEEFYNCDKLYYNDALQILSALTTFKRSEAQIVPFVDYAGIACVEIQFLTRILTDPNFDLELDLEIELDDHANIRTKELEVALIRSRFENVLALLACLRSTADTNRSLAEAAFPLLIELSRIIYCGRKSAIINSDTGADSAKIDIWSDVLRTSIVLAIGSVCIREDFNTELCISISLREVTALLDSSLWQQQLEGLLLIRILLRTDKKYSSDAVPTKDIASTMEVLPQSRENSITARQNPSTLTYSTASKKALSSSVKLSRQDTQRNNKSTKTKGESSVPVPTTRGLLSGGRVDELCRSGSLRSIIWLLTSRREVVRKTAAEVLIAMVSQCKPVSTINPKDVVSANSDLWASLVEQGMVALLEAVSSGSRVYIQTNHLRKNESKDSINSNSSNNNIKPSPTYRQVLFPETKIRRVADYMLRQLTVAVESSEPLSTRLTSAMLFSGNAKLRLNIFSSLFFLAGRSSALARRWWNSTPPSSITTAGTVQHLPTKKGQLSSQPPLSPPLPPRLQSSATTVAGDSSGATTNGGALFRDALSIASKDPAEFRSLLRFLLSLLMHCSTDKSMQPLPVRESSGAVAEDDHSTETIRIRKVVAPIVVVNRAGAWTRMACPLLEVIFRHSSELGSMIQDSAVKHLGDFDYRSASELISQRLSSLDDNSFLRLEGSYNIWQEVFSHMADSYLMKLSSANMSAEDLLAALALARRWNMKTLESNYAHVLSRRISNTTLISVLNCSVGYGCSESNINLMLCISSVDYLIKNCEKILLKDFGEIIRALTVLIGKLLS